MKHIKITYECILELDGQIEETILSDMLEDNLYELDNTSNITVITSRIISSETLKDDTLEDYTVSLDIDVQAKDTEDAIDKVMEHIVNVEYTTDIQVVDVNVANEILESDDEQF